MVSWTWKPPSSQGSTPQTILFIPGKNIIKGATTNSPIAINCRASETNIVVERKNNPRPESVNIAVMTKGNFLGYFPVLVFQIISLKSAWPKLNPLGDTGNDALFLKPLLLKSTP